MEEILKLYANDYPPGKCWLFYAVSDDAEKKQ
jgi:hypothetical protein